MRFFSILAILVLNIAITVQAGEQCSRSEVIIDNIMTRSSVRSYTSQPVEAEKIETMLRAAMSAPTARNMQPWSFVVITDRETLDRLPDVNKGSAHAASAQLAVVVCGTPEKAATTTSWIMDCSAASQNILLSAHAMGLGAVWTGIYPDDGSDRVAKLQKLLSLPEGTFPLNIIIIGYPDKEPTIKDKWDPAKIKYIK